MFALLNWRRRPLFRGVWLGLACAVAAWLISCSPLFRGLEDWMFDACFAWRGNRPTQTRIFLVEIDDESLHELNKPLAYLSPALAEVVMELHARKAAAVGVDLLPAEYTDKLPEVARVGGDGDAWAMGRAVLKCDNVVLPAVVVVDRVLRPPQAWLPKPPDGREPTELGFVNLTEDGDQFVRRQRLVLTTDDNKPLPHFALALYARARGQQFTWDEQSRVLSIGETPIPLDAEGKLRINFAGPPGRFTRVAFRDVLAAARGDPKDLPDFRGAVVIVGLTATGSQDMHPTPYANNYASYFADGAGGVMSGSELHAHILATLDDRAYITTPPWLYPPPLLLAFGALLGASLARLNLVAGLLLTVAHHFGWKGLALLGFLYAGWRTEVVAMLLLGFLVYSATFAWRWRTLRRTFGVVKSRAVVEALDASADRLGTGQLREVTILFADLRNFSDYCREHTPGQVVALLNAYFGVVVPILEREGGTLNSYMGDGVMVLFNAPAPCPDHALRAVRAGRAMVAAVAANRKRWADLGMPDLRIGVGIHTGSAVVGAIGSPQRLEFTAIGDAVNAAARLESATKECGVDVLISVATCGGLPAAERARLGCDEAPFMVELKGVGPMNVHALRSHARAG